MTVECLDADSVTAVLAGTMSPEARAAIDEHVDSCDACRRLVAAAARDHVHRGTGEAAPAPSTEPASAPRAARHVMLAPGAEVGRYVVTDFLGAGAMGAVYGARDPKLDREVAIKVVATAASETRGRRLVREAQAMARVSHPNVVPIYDAGQDDSVVFIAMKKIDGAPLPAYLARTDLSSSETLRLLCGAGRGLAAAHAAGIVHRDFKPDNVLVDAAGTAQVGDFGLAAMGDEPSPEGRDAPAEPWRTADGTIVGTPAYMAPEVRRGQRADAASDQYSFALTVGEALGDYQPRRVRRALERACSDDPKQRFPSMTELLAILERRSVVLPIGIIVTLVAAGILAWPRAGDPAAACDNEARAALATTFGPVERAVTAAHLTTLTPIHAHDAALALAQLDRYVGDWTAMRQGSCRATLVTGEQSTDLDDLRSQCLDARLEEIAVVANELATIDEARARSVADIASVLGDIEQCADAKALRAAGTVEPRGLRKRIAETHLMMEQGFFAKAEPELDAILAEARRAQLPALEAETLLSRSTLLARTGRNGASDGFHEALVIAERIGNTSIRVDAQIALLADATGDRARASEVELLAKLVDDGLRQLPGPQTKRRALEMGNLASYYEDKHDFPAAERAAQIAADGFREVAGPTHPYTLGARALQAHIQMSEEHLDKAVAIVLDVRAELLRTLGEDHPALVDAQLSAGVYLSFANRLDEAAAAFQRALELATKVYGPGHPAVAQALRKLAFLDFERKHYREAADEFQRAIGIVEHASKRTDDPNLVPLLVGLGQAQVETREFTTAVATLERALAIWGDSQRTAHLRPQANFALAEALWETNGDHQRARALATEAHAQFLANKGPWLPLAAEVERWLSTHR